MNVGHQHVRALAKNLRSAIAVVHVPVDNHHALQAELGDRQLGCDRDVVEQAEPHRTVLAGMVARRAQRAEAGAALIGDQMPDHRARASRRVDRGLVRGRADDRSSSI
jgi:hypothetical protein